MGMTRRVELRFDLSNPYDALTYKRLQESGDRSGYERNRSMQANYLLSIMLGARDFEPEKTGLDAVPDIRSEMKKYIQFRKRAVAAIAYAESLVTYEEDELREDSGTGQGKSTAGLSVRSGKGITNQVLRLVRPEQPIKGPDQFFD